MLTMQSIISIHDLQHFFLSYVRSNNVNHEGIDLTNIETFSIDRIERVIQLDFIDPLQE